MEDNEKVELEIEVKDPKLISVNEQYMHPVRKTKRGSYVSYFAPTQALKDLQSFYEELFNELIPGQFIDDIKQILNDRLNGISLYLEIGMPESEIRNCDISNFIKAIEDCIVIRTGIDDSRHYIVSARKSVYNSEDKSWILRITYSVDRIKLYNENDLGGNHET